MRLFRRKTKQPAVPAKPKWLSDTLEVLAGQPNADLKQIAWADSADIAMRNAAGFVVRCYNSHTDDFDWIFANGHWPRLIDADTNEYFADDPFRSHREDIPLAEFVAYLNDWYFPRMHKQKKAFA